MVKFSLIKAQICKFWTIKAYFPHPFCNPLPVFGFRVASHPLPPLGLWKIPPWRFLPTIRTLDNSNYDKNPSDNFPHQKIWNCHGWDCWGELSKWELSGLGIIQMEIVLGKLSEEAVPMGVLLEKLSGLELSAESCPGGSCLGKIIPVGVVWGKLS